MKGKMTTGAGKPSSSEPWKQTPEPRQAALSLRKDRKGSHPLSQLCLSLCLKSGLRSVVGVARTKLQRSHFQRGSQGCFPSPPGDLSYFWERSEVTFQAEGEKEGELAGSEGGGTESLEV